MEIRRAFRLDRPALIVVPSSLRYFPLFGSSDSAERAFVGVSFRGTDAAGALVLKTTKERSEWQKICRGLKPL